MFGIPMVPRVVSGGCGEVTATRTIRYSRNSDKISAFHYSVWKHRSINPYDNIWMPFRWTCEYEDGSVREVSAIGKIGNVRNDRLMFKRVFRKVEKRISSFGFMDLVLFDAQSAVDICSERIERGAKLYKTK